MVRILVWCYCAVLNDVNMVVLHCGVRWFNVMYSIVCVELKSECGVVNGMVYYIHHASQSGVVLWS